MKSLDKKKLVVTYLGITYKVQPSFAEMYNQDIYFCKCDNCDLKQFCMVPGKCPLVFCCFDIGFDYFFEKI